MSAKKRGIKPESERAAARANGVVVYHVYSMSGAKLKTLRRPYDGTKAGAKRAALSMQEDAGRYVTGYTHSGSVLVATDESGAPRWVISPNLAVFTDAADPEAAALLRRIDVDREPRRPRSSGRAHPLVVEYHAYDYHNQSTKRGVVRLPYDGTRQGARAAAAEAQAEADRRIGNVTFSGSVLVATDESGAPRWLISPNLAVFTDADAPEAAPLLRFVGGAAPRRAPASAAAPRPAAAAGRRPEVQLHVDYRPGGSRRRAAPLRAAYDGTREGARAAALGLQRRATDLGFEGAESVIVALDEGGDPRWVVSPDLAVFTPATAPGAAAPLRWAGFNAGGGARAASRGTKR